MKQDNELNLPESQKSKTELVEEIQALRDRLTASEEILSAIRQGEVDALVISTPQGRKVFTLQSADLSYRLLVEEMQQGAVILSTEGLILYCNKSFSKLLRQPLEKLIGSYFEILISSHDLPLFQARVKQAERGERYPVEMFLNTRDGLEIPVYLSINHLLLDDSPINCIVITDLTEQKRHEKTLASEKLARLILEQAGEAILVCDNTGQIIRASAIAQELWGENLLFQSFDKLRLLYLFNSKFCLLTSQKVTSSAAHIDPDLPIKVPFSIAPVLDGESYKELEVEFERRDGQVLNLVLNARPLADQDNQFRGAVVILTNITQRKQAENALQAANNELEIKVAERTQQLQETNNLLQVELFERQRREKILQNQAQLIDLAHDAILTVDLNNIITFWNHGAAEMYGFSKAEALGKDLAILLQTHFPKPLTEINNQVFEHGRWEGELIQQKRDGTLIVVASRWIVQWDLGGGPIEILKINTDITQQKRAEDALRASSARFAGILDIAEDAIISVDQSQKITLFNKGAEQIFGYTAAEVLGQELDLLLPKRMAFIHRQHIAKFSNSSGAARQMGERNEVFGRRKDGTEFPAEASISKLELNGEKIYTAILRDITERKIAETALREREERFRKIFEEGPLGMAIVGLNYRFIKVNSMLCQMVGYSELELVALTFADITHPDDLEKDVQLAQRLFQGEIPFYQIEKRYFKKNQEILWVSLTGSIVRDEDAQPIYYLAMIKDITERKRAEESLRKYERIVSTTADGIVLLNRNYIYQMANPAYLSWRKKNCNEIVGLSVTDIMGQELFEKVKPLLDRCLAGEIIQFEKWFEYADAVKKFLSVTYTPYFAAEGDISGVVVSLRDITKLKQAEESLQQSESTLRSFFNSGAMPMGIVELHDGDILHISDNWAAAQFFETTPEAMKNQFASMLGVPPAIIELWTSYYQQSEQIQAPVRFEHFYETSTNQGWLFVSVCPIEVSSSGYPRFSYVAKDITDRKQAEWELRELNLALENAVEGIARLDVQGRYMSINRAYAEKCGYQLNEMLGMEWPPTVHPEDRPKMLAAYQEMLTKGKVEAEAKGLRKDGSTFYKQLVMISAYDREINFVGHYCFMKDITERKKAEVELAAAKEAAEAANRAKSEFLANMSHEIRTPMNAILGFSELLQGSIADPQPRAYLKSIAASGRTLLALINDILDLSKIEAGKLQLEYEPVDVRSLIREIQQILDQTAVKKGLSLLVEIDETLPKAILFDPVRLRQILFNSVGNALKFTEAGFVKISVLAQLEPSTLSNGVQMEITVADTGIGICFDQQESIFEAFKQTEGQSTRKYGGTGLGLAITKRLTEMLGGTVSLQSELRKGSAFTFIFPNLTITESKTRSVIPSKLDEDLNQFSTATVLVVDDVQYNLDLIAGYFAGSKHRLLFAQDGQQAIEVAQTYCPDAILMDLWMPKMDGLQATQWLKQDEGTKNIPIVIVTAVSRPEDEVAVRSLSQGFLRKPVSRSQLVSALKQIIPQEANYFAVNQAPITPSQIDRIKPNPNTLTKLPELVEKLRQEEEITWLELCKTMKRRDIQAFVERLRDLVQEYQCQVLLEYLTTLESQLSAFDWERLPKTIQRFPEVREQLL